MKVSWFSSVTSPTRVSAFYLLRHPKLTIGSGEQRGPEKVGSVHITYRLLEMGQRASESTLGCLPSHSEGLVAQVAV